MSCAGVLEVTSGLATLACHPPRAYALTMRYALLALLVLLSVAHAEQPLLVVGGDGHAYAIGANTVLLHVHRGQRKVVPVPPVAGMFPGRTGVLVNAGDRIWLVEQGQPTEVAKGHIVEAVVAADATYLYVWSAGELSILYVP